MFAFMLSDMATHATNVLAASSSNSDGILFLLAMGPAAGIGFYTLIYLRYRNTDKRFEYERKTSSDIAEVQGFDRPAGSVKGTERSRIQGDNSRNPRQRLGRNTTIIRHG